MTCTLILLRHDESEWNKRNLFTGWVDVSLSEEGIEEVKHADELLQESGVLPDLLFISLLCHAVNIAYYALDAVNRLWIPVERSWRLNERYYGVLQGRDKEGVHDEYDEEQFMLWRRFSDITPSTIEAGTEFFWDPNLCYLEEIPASKCLEGVIAHFMPYWESTLVPTAKTDKIMVIGAHDNSLCVLVRYLDGISDEDIIGIDIPTSIPLVYELDGKTPKPVREGGTYPDPEAEMKVVAVTNQGG